MERTHEEATEALHAGREGRHPEAASVGASASELCDKHGLQPTVFYRWQKEFFENGAAAFQPKARLLSKWNGKPSKKGTGFEQPLAGTNTGTSTCHTSTSVGRFITCAAFWTAIADTSSIGICGRKPRQNRRQQAA
jgi:hypothetical protein